MSDRQFSNFTEMINDEKALSSIDTLIRHNFKICLDKVIDEAIRYKVDAQTRIITDNAVSEDDFKNLCELQAGFRRAINDMKPSFNFINNKVEEEVKDVEAE